MKLAILNAFPFHYEMFAHVLDFCTKFSLSVSCYTNDQNDYKMLEMYKKFFLIEFKNIDEYVSKNYDYSFLLTDDDKYSLHKLHNNLCKKNLISLEHHSDRITTNRYILTYVQLREYKLRTPPSDPETWVLPVWNYPKRLTKFNTLSVICIGDNSAKSSSELKKIFSNYTQINFYIVNRFHNFIHDTTDNNIFIYTQLDSEVMFDLCCKCHYILVTDKKPEHIHHSVSASIPLGYSVGCIPLCPHEMKESFNLPGIQGYSSSNNLLTFPDFTELNITLNVLIERRDNVYKKILNQGSI